MGKAGDGELLSVTGFFVPWFGGAGRWQAARKQPRKRHVHRCETVARILSSRGVRPVVAGCTSRRRAEVRQKKKRSSPPFAAWWAKGGGAFVGGRLRAGRQASPSASFSLSRRKCPVRLSGQSATWRGVPQTTSSPPLSPPSGPRSITWSAHLITSRLCSMMMSE